MKVKQLADCLISIRRFDNGEQIDFAKDTEIEVDEATGNHLLNLKIFNEEGIPQADFIEI